jgi:hypothetical protein
MEIGQVPSAASSAHMIGVTEHSGAMRILPGISRNTSLSRAPSSASIRAVIGMVTRVSIGGTSYLVISGTSIACRAGNGVT